MPEMWVQSLGWEDPLEKKIATPVFLPGKSHGQRSLVGYNPWGHKESDTTVQLSTQKELERRHSSHPFGVLEKSMPIFSGEVESNSVIIPDPLET